MCIKQRGSGSQAGQTPVPAASCPSARRRLGRLGLQVKPVEGVRTVWGMLVFLEKSRGPAAGARCNHSHQSRCSEALTWSWTESGHVAGALDAAFPAEDSIDC